MCRTRYGGNAGAVAADFFQGGGLVGSVGYWPNGLKTLNQWARTVFEFLAGLQARAGMTAHRISSDASPWAGDLASVMSGGPVRTANLIFT